MPIRLTGKEIGSLAVASSQITSSATTTATTSGTATVLMTVGPVFFEGGDYLFCLDAPAVQKGTTNINLELWVDGVFSQSITGVVTVNTTLPGGVLTTKVTLTPGNHTLTVRGFVDAGTGTLLAGTGATATNPPATAFVIAF